MRLAVSALALLAAGAAAAEPLRVRAGEHGGYSRLVIDAEPGLDWRWRLEGRRLVVEAPGAEGFDVAPARAARPARVAAFSAGPGALEAALACDCGVRVMTMTDGRIVLDLSEAAPRPAPASAPPRPRPARIAARNGVETSEPAPEPAEARQPVPETPEPPQADAPAEPAPPRPAEPAEPELASAPGAGAPPAGATAADEAPAESRPQALGATPQAEADDAPAPEISDSEASTLQASAPEASAPEASAPEGEDPLAMARQRLLRQLERAAEEGFLTLKEPLSSEQAAEPVAPEDEAEALDAPVRARDALDIAAETAARRAEARAPQRPEHCLPDAALDLAAWGGEADGPPELGALRRALVGEFDRPDPDAVLDYARALLRWRFGLEARMALSSFGAKVDAPRALRELSFVLEGDAPPAGGVLAAGADCPGAHGVWGGAAAALEGALDLESLDPEAMNPILARLPGDLRTAAVLPMATAALEGGAVGKAAALAALAERAQVPPPDGDAMLDVLLARIDAAAGEARAAEARLAPLVERMSLAGVEAMIRLVEFRAARGAAPPAGLAETMEAAAFVQKDSPLGRRLLSAAAAARALGEGLAPALRALRTLSQRGGDPASASAAVRNLLIDYAPDPEEAPAYAEALLAHWDMVGEGPEGDRARIAVARKLAALDLGALGGELLAPALTRGVGEARLAAAEAALAAGAPERALAQLETLDDPAAGRLRAEAHAARFDYAAALAAAEATGDPELISRYGWMAGEWRAAARGGAPDRRLLAAWMAGEAEPAEALREAVGADEAAARRLEALAPPAPAQAEPDSLAASRAALEAAKRRRALMGAVIDPVEEGGADG
jgi:hypothetical protein